MFINVKFLYSCYQDSTTFGECGWIIVCKENHLQKLRIMDISGSSNRKCSQSLSVIPVKLKNINQQSIGVIFLNNLN